MVENLVRQLVMTATCTREILKSCNRLLNTLISHSVWGNNKEQEMRNLSFGIACMMKPSASVFE